MDTSIITISCSMSGGDGTCHNLACGISCGCYESTIMLLPTSPTPSGRRDASSPGWRIGLEDKLVSCFCATNIPKASPSFTSLIPRRQVQAWSAWVPTWLPPSDASSFPATQQAHKVIPLCGVQQVISYVGHRTCKFLRATCTRQAVVPIKEAGSRPSRTSFPALI